MKFIRFEIHSHPELYNEEIKLRDKVLREPLGLKLTTDFLKKDKEDIHFCIINDDDRMIACLLIKRISEKEVKLRQMAVSESERGKGIGSLLIKKTESQLKKMEVKKIQLHARKYAEEFYRKSGYSPVGSEFMEIGIPHIKMEKMLSL